MSARTTGSASPLHPSLWPSPVRDAQPYDKKDSLHGGRSTEDVGQVHKEKDYGDSGHEILDTDTEIEMALLGSDSEGRSPTGSWKGAERLGIFRPRKRGAFLFLFAPFFLVVLASAILTSLILNDVVVPPWAAPSGKLDASTLAALSIDHTPAQNASTSAEQGPWPEGFRPPLAVSLSPSLGPPGELDVVISYYDDSLPTLQRHIASLRSTLAAPGRAIRVIVYVKHHLIDADKLRHAVGVDAVIKLVNFGREGGTYLHHMLSNYEHGKGPLGGLAGRTLFIQSNLQYPYAAYRRLSRFRPDTGFLSLSSCDITYCGDEASGNYSWPRMKQIFDIMHPGEGCDREKGQFTVYRGQFFVSRRKILANPKERYIHVKNLVEAPEGDPIYKEGVDFKYPGWLPTPSDPYFGHALERSWAFMLGCGDPILAHTCGEGPQAWMDYFTDWWKTEPRCQCVDAEDARPDAGSTRSHRGLSS